MWRKCGGNVVRFGAGVRVPAGVRGVLVLARAGHLLGHPTADRRPTLPPLGTAAGCFGAMNPLALRGRWRFEAVDVVSWSRDPAPQRRWADRRTRNAKSVHIFGFGWCRRCCLVVLLASLISLLLSFGLSFLFCSFRFFYLLLYRFCFLSSFLPSFCTVSLFAVYDSYSSLSISSLSRQAAFSLFSVSFLLCRFHCFLFTVL